MLPGTENQQEAAPEASATPDKPEVDIHPSRIAPHMEAYRAAENHVFRVKYRELSDFEKRVMEELKGRAYWLHVHIECHVPDSRERTIALEKLEESIMWAVKAITA